ncbi:uncharacterized protein LOC122245152 [Penaeus japonicus]|uniref:Crustacean female specific hormone n=1 Tax=Penaeus japonicus TaxID=27405 RepID=A0A292FP97_PENJP|nr:uncharacterized protein LOC122245152 [Penaeus japonicus]BBA53799.1 crustacean female specific hormone [Penaeus japonicus]
MAPRAAPVLSPLAAPPLLLLLLLLVLVPLHSSLALELSYPSLGSDLRPPLYIPGRPLEEGGQKPHGGAWSYIRHRPQKKRHLDDFIPGLLQHYSEKEVEDASRSEYKAVPSPIVHTSQMLHQGINCSALASNLHENHIKPELQLRPDWIHISELIGDCPTHYITRELPPMYSPAVVLEAVCTCGGSQCSRDGHQCVPVTRHIPVWVRRGPNVHVLDVEELTVACACVRRPSVGGNFVFSPAVQS